MQSKSTPVVIRPVPDWKIGDWCIALFLAFAASAIILTTTATKFWAPGSISPPAALIMPCLLIGALMVPLGLAIRHAGSLQFSDEGIVLTRLFVPYRRLAWRDLRSAYLRWESDGEVDRRWAQVFLVLRGGHNIRFPISFPEEQHSVGSAAHRANELFLTQMANRRIVIENLG